MGRWIWLVLIVVVIAWSGRGRALGRDEQLFEGVYLTAFEASEFYPGLHCPENIPYWLAAEPDSGFFDQVNQAGAGAFSAPVGVRPWFFHVRFVGRLSPPGKYGHLGVYPREVTVIRVLEITPAPECAPRSSRP